MNLQMSRPYEVRISLPGLVVRGCGALPMHAIAHALYSTARLGHGLAAVASCPARLSTSGCDLVAGTVDDLVAFGAGKDHEGALFPSS